MKTVLATDLDGTFLGGSEADRAALYDWIARRRDEIVLVFVSGRGFDFMRQLADTLPVRPDHVIGDVGTRVGTGARFDPLPDVDAWLDACWPADAGERIARAMQEHPELEPQPGVAGRRRSYFYSRHEAALRAAPDLERLGFDTLMSDNRFFDVLPRGVQKGPTLLRTLAALGLPAGRTLVAGDTLNDLSMFATGLAGVAVGNREPALDAAVAGLANVHRSPHPGAAGVLDALEHFHREGTIHGIVTGHRLSPTAV